MPLVPYLSYIDKHFETAKPFYFLHGPFQIKTVKKYLHVYLPDYQNCVKTRFQFDFLLISNIKKDTVAPYSQNTFTIRFSSSQQSKKRLLLAAHSLNRNRSCVAIY